ncbi:MAG: hypothetical protein M3R04_10675 [bacterium]|nr:hypothetical protein [bacterium]
MKSLRDIIGIIAATLIGSMLLAGSARAETDIDILGDFDIIIGDSGDRYDGWESSETRTYVRVSDRRGGTHDHYFDSLASAFFVLRERYGTVRVLDIEVPEYAGSRHEEHGHQGHGIIDGSRAWYFWDTERYARGGLPLILAYYDRHDAEDMSYYRNGEVMNFEQVVMSLKRWSERSSSRIYWRGRDNWNNSSWNSAWNNRWQGYGWDRDRGWSVSLNIGKGGIRGGSVRYGNGGTRARVIYRDNNNHDHHNNGRGRGNERGRSRDRDRDRDRDNDRDDDDDDDDDYRRERDRQRNR